jgi:hypothetical protein
MPKTITPLAFYTYQIEFLNEECSPEEITRGNELALEMEKFFHKNRKEINSLTLGFLKNLQAIEFVKFSGEDL